MNKSLQKQIKIYTGVASALLAADRASGQIVYHDIMPDTTLNCINNSFQHYYLDLDQDGNIEFVFKGNNYQMVTSGITLSEKRFGAFADSSSSSAIMGTQVIYSSGSSTFYKFLPKKLNTGDSISPQNWIHNAHSSVLFEKFEVVGQSVFNAGQFNVGDDAYLGLRFYTNSGYNFGWVRIEIIADSVYKIKSYAYQSQPYVGIAAGDTGNITGINNLNGLLSILQRNNIIEIQSPIILNNSTINVFDLLGKEILKRNFSGDQIQFSIDKKGIYFVEVRCGEKVYRKKVFIY